MARREARGGGTLASEGTKSSRTEVESDCLLESPVRSGRDVVDYRKDSVNPRSFSAHSHPVRFPGLAVDLGSESSEHDPTTAL